MKISCKVFKILSLVMLLANVGYAQETTVIDRKGTLKTVTSNTVTTATTAPSTPVDGDVWFDTTENITKVWDGATWQNIQVDSTTALWDTNTDTGIQVEEGTDDDIIRFDTAGNERMQIDENGNVGIGTTAPTQTLDVDGSTRLRGALNDGNNEAGTAGQVLSSTGSGANWTNTIQNLNIENAGIASLEIESTAGTNSLQQKLILRTHASNRGGGILWEDNSNANRSSFFGRAYRGGSATNALVYRTTTTGETLTDDYAATPNADVKLVINDNGNVGIGTASPSHLLHVNGAARSTQSTWATTSDKRIKRNIQAYTGGLKEIIQLRPVQFQFNALSGNKDLDKLYVGVLAQEIEKILPNTVEIQNDKEGISGLEDLRIFNNNEITYTLINAIKELNVKNKALEAENKAIKSENKTLQESINTILKRLEALEQK